MGKYIVICNLNFIGWVIFQLNTSMNNNVNGCLAKLKKSVLNHTE